MTSNIIPRLSISDSMSAAWVFHSGVSRTVTQQSPSLCSQLKAYAVGIGRNFTKLSCDSIEVV